MRPAATRQELKEPATAGAALVRKSVRELAQPIAARAVSPVEVLDAYLAVIAALNPRLKAIVTLAAAQARDAAKRAENAVMKGEPLGPLHGLPIGVKDVTPTAGIRTIFASPLFKDYVPTEPKRCAASRPPAPSCSPKQYAGIRLRRRHQQCAVRPDPQSVESGAQSGRFFRRLGGRRRQRVVQIAQGTDFGCSIRIPAAFSGIVGIRPTPGLTPSRPLHLPWDPGQVNGPLARRRRRAFP